MKKVYLNEWAICELKRLGTGQNPRKVVNKND